MLKQAQHLIWRGGERFREEGRGRHTKATTDESKDLENDMICAKFKGERDFYYSPKIYMNHAAPCGGLLRAMENRMKCFGRGFPSDFNLKDVFPGLALEGLKSSWHVKVMALGINY